MTRKIEFKLGQFHTYHYETDVESPDYALLLCHGGGGWGGMYDPFVLPYVQKHDIDVWAWDQPGFGQTGTRGDFDFEVAREGLQALEAEIRSQHDKPIFVMGNSFGGAIASSALFDDSVQGVVVSASPLIMGSPTLQKARQMFASPPMQGFLNSPMGSNAFLDLDAAINWDENYGDPKAAREIVAHPLHQGRMRLSGWASIALWEPPRPLAENKKPMLMIFAERDPMLPGVDALKKEFDAVGGPTEMIVRDTDKHQLMLFDTEWTIGALDGWFRKHI